MLDNYKLEKCKNIADYAELSRARNSIYSFHSRWDLPDAILISIFMRGLGPSYKSWNSTFWLHNNLASTKNKDGSETDGFTFREVVDFAQKEEALQSQDDKNEVHALSAGELSVIIARNQLRVNRRIRPYLCQGKLWYWFQLKDAAFTRSQTSSAFPAYAIKDGWLAPWHARMGHLGEDNLKKLVNMSSVQAERAPALQARNTWDLPLRVHTHRYRRSIPDTWIWGSSLLGNNILDDFTGWTQITPLRLLEP
ncbi:hypothetical protein E4U23_005436 [Claviceps purpurea]|nr:hypothetical protein E4U23_005436 [Claviceps purpurea]